MKIQAKTFQTITTTDTQDITITGFGTPTAVLFFWNGVNTTGTGATPDAIMGMGATDGTDEWALGASSKDSLDTTADGRVSDPQWCIKAMLDDGIQAGAAATFSTWITDGVRISWGYNVLGTGVYVTAIFFQCDGAKVGQIALDADPKAVTTIGFESDLVFVGCIGHGTADVADGNAIMSVGVGINDGSDTQRCLSTHSTTGVGTTAICTELFTDSIAAQVYGDAVTWRVAIESYDASGFDFNVLSGSTGSDFVFYLALDLGEHQKYLGTIDSPTSTGDDAQTGPGFEPDAVIHLLSMAQAVDTLYTDGDAGAFGVSVIDDQGAELCHAIAMEDGAGTTNTESIYDTDAIDLNKDDGTAAHDATYKEMTADGWTLTFSVADGTTRKWGALAIGGAAAGGTTLTVADTSHAQTAGTIALTQKSTLTVGGADHATTADTIPLVQKHTLTVAGANNATTVDPIPLVQKNTLTVGGADHAQTAGAIPLTQKHTLTVGGADHAQTAGTIALGTGTTLIVGGADHAQSVDAIALTQKHTLAVAGANHATTADTIALTQAHTLAVSDTSHATTVDAISLGTGITLIVAGANHLTTVDTIALVQKGTLTVSDTSHAQSVDTIALIQANVLAVSDTSHAQTVGNILLDMPSGRVSTAYSATIPGVAISATTPGITFTSN